MHSPSTKQNKQYHWYLYSIIEFKLFLKSSFLFWQLSPFSFISQPPRDSRKKPPYFFETFTYNLEVNKKVKKIYFH